MFILDKLIKIQYLGNETIRRDSNRDSINDIVLGWVKYVDHNGMLTATAG